MRLLLVTQDFPPETGGIQSYMGNLARAIAPSCEDFAVVAPTSSKSSPEHDASFGFPVQRIAIHSSWLVLPLLARLRGIARAHGSTHVLYAQWFPALAGRLLPTSVKQAVIVHGRELLRHPLGSAGLALAGPTLARMDAVIPNSRHTASLLPPAVASDRVHVVHPGVDAVRFAPPSPESVASLRVRLGIAPDAPVVSCLTRLVPRKGVDTLVDSARILRERVPNAVVLIGGSGPDRPRIEDRIRQSGAGDAIRLVGRVPDEDLSAFLSLGVFALLSREEPRDVEGFGMVLAEAQSCGAPVVAARSGGMPEAVGPGAGTVVPPDDPSAAADAFVELLNPERRAACAQAGIAHAATLGWDSRAREIADILQGTAAKNF